MHNSNCILQTAPYKLHVAKVLLVGRGVKGGGHFFVPFLKKKLPIFKFFAYFLPQILPFPYFLAILATIPLGFKLFFAKKFNFANFFPQSSPKFGVGNRIFH